MMEIFDYLRFTPTDDRVGYKIDLYNTAQVCREFSQYAIPLLWRDLTFALDDSARVGNPYQNKFFKLLTPESAKNFVYTKRLSLYLNVHSTLFTESRQCLAAFEKLSKLLDVYYHVSPTLKFLDLRIEPFISTDAAHDGLWPILNCCNGSIYHFLGQVMNRESKLKDFKLSLGRGAWRYEEEFRPHMEQVLWMVGPKVTNLNITESPAFLARWLPTMRRLRILEFH